MILAGGVSASWYWPFGSDDDSAAPARRLSELMRPASLLIDEAADLAEDGKSQEAVEKYRAALMELDNIERENPDRAASKEFDSVRTKRAYVNAAIDTLLLEQVRSNAKSVAVSDTTELEKRLAAERAGKSEKGKPAAKDEKAAKDNEATEKAGKAEKGEKAAGAEKVAKAEKAAPADVKPPARNLPRREQAMADIDRGDYEAAEIIVNEMLTEKPNSAMALNLKATMEMAQGKFKDAERTLDQAIMSNPRSYYAYYNMADIVLQANPGNKTTAKRYYETGRAVGGPVDEQLEAMLK